MNNANLAALAATIARLESGVNDYPASDDGAAPAISDLVTSPTAIVAPTMISPVSLFSLGGAQSSTLVSVAPYVPAGTRCIVVDCLYYADGASGTFEFSWVIKSSLSAFTRTALKWYCGQSDYNGSTNCIIVPIENGQFFYEYIKTGAGTYFATNLTCNLVGYF